jgi:N-carbamoyl-L-amino-acid hydrolase
VVTTGRVRVEPGGANQVPGLVELLLDFRDPDRQTIVTMGQAIAGAAAEAAAAFDVTVDWRPEEVTDPVPLDEGIRQLIRRSASDLGLSTMDVPSGAGHDSQNMAKLVPTAMVFVPSRDGRSHSPAEYTADRDVVAGADVLLATLLELADS